MHAPLTTLFAFSVIRFEPGEASKINDFMQARQAKRADTHGLTLRSWGLVMMIVIMLVVMMVVMVVVMIVVVILIGGKRR